jgi:uncharacterized protein YecT (DUF1311 family)
MLIFFSSISFAADDNNIIDTSNNEPEHDLRLSELCTGPHLLWGLECAKKKFEYADNKLNITYKALLAKLRDNSPDLLKRKKELIESQRAWLKYRDNYCHFVGYLSVPNNASPHEYEECRANITETRVWELHERHMLEMDKNEKAGSENILKRFARLRKIIKKHIHPKVFEMIQCWISDGNYPVLTEFNLEALYNHNQFDYDHLKIDKEWISYRDREGFSLRYKFINQDKENNKYKVLFTNNGGGSMTEVWEIEYEINHREIIVKDKPEKIETLKVISVNLVSL